MLSAFHIRIASGGAVFFDIQRATNHIYYLSNGGVAKLKIFGGIGVVSFRNPRIRGPGSLLRTIFITIFFVGAPGSPGRGLVRVF